MLVLEKMNQIAEPAFIRSIGRRPLEARGHAPAQSAERSRVIGKGLAEKLFTAGVAQRAVQGLDFLKARPANGKRRNFRESKAADTAVGGKDDREQAGSRGMKSPFNTFA